MSIKQQNPYKIAGHILNLYGKERRECLQKLKKENSFLYSQVKAAMQEVTRVNTNVEKNCKAAVKALAAANKIARTTLLETYGESVADQLKRKIADDAAVQKNDAVNHPSHYVKGGIEVIDFLEAYGLDKSFCLGNVVKYIARSDYKGVPLQDLKKAQWYLTREIGNREKQAARELAEHELMLQANKVVDENQG